MATAPTVRAAEFRELFREYTPPTGSFILDIPAVDSYLTRHLPLDVELRPVDFLPSSLESLLVPEPGTASMRLPICDACVCIGALHHLAADDVLLQEFYQALNPGGLVYLADPQVGSSTAEFLDAVIPNHQGIYRDFTQVTYPGFTTLVAGPKACPWVFESTEHTVAFCKELFGLDLSDELVLAALIKKGSANNQLPWELGYAVLRKDVL